ncbi:TetR/AcrR family transcriptional regulator [Cytobacillus sp. Hz8]|uniref:TetR/AcrR family transcriptional regulator n=1 Tax=Cytobacillus sp. Hz8 TaxID=3347168 RepID=UPI0035DF8F20
MDRKKQNSEHESLNQSKIIQTAIDLINKDGLKKLSMRNVANALNTSAASLYWHLENKYELLQLLSEQICKTISFPDSSKDWYEQLIELGHEYRQALLSIRDSFEIMTETVPMTPDRLQLIENIYRILMNAGFGSEDVPATASLFNNYILSFVRDEMKQVYIANIQGLEVNVAFEQARKMFKSLSVNKYPSLVELADYSVSVNSDKQFEFGLHVLLDGLNKRLKQ